MSKIGFDYLEELDIEKQNEFCYELSRGYRGALSTNDYLNSEFDSFGSFIDHAFTWSSTKKGEEYWNNISGNLYGYDYYSPDEDEDELTF